MGDIGALNDVINATEVKLYLNNDGNEYVLLQELELVLDRPETREAVALGAVFFFGQHNHIFDATLLLSANDIATYLDLNKINAFGALTDGNYLLEYLAKDSTKKTITVTSETPRLSFEKLAEGGTKIRIRFRITEEVTAADIS